MKTNTAILRHGLRRTLLASCLGAALALGVEPAEATSTHLRDFVAAARADWQQARSGPAPARRTNPLVEQWKLLHPAAPPRPTGGITHVVTNCNDAGAGSLRDASLAAVSGDTIDMSSLACSSITLTTGAIVSGANDLAVIGPGLDELTVSGNSNDPVLVHVGTGQLYMRGFTVTDGMKYMAGATDALGGCVYSQGTVLMADAAAKYCYAQAVGSGDAAGGAVYAKAGVSLVGSTISGSSAVAAAGHASGGGLYSRGGVEVKYSIFRNNTATNDSGTGSGGAAFLSGDVAILGSTIHGNTADQVGGLALTGSSASGTLTINHSTITDNYGSTSYLGAGVYLGANALITNSTISGNIEANPGHTKYGAGLSAKYGTTVELRSSIVSGNFLFDSGVNLPSDIGPAGSGDPPQITGTNNLIGESASTLPADTLITMEPRLGPLAANGGPTPTMALLSGSLAFNRGISGDTYDQRGAGYPRLVGAGVDIGAFESDALFVDGFD